MRKDDLQLGRPSRLYQNTKANIEALTGLTGGEEAYATDTGEKGHYDAVAAEWSWGGGSGGGLIFQRNLSANLELADGESMVVVGYINQGLYDLTLNGDSDLMIL
jgi:hypothetical protein